MASDSIQEIPQQKSDLFEHYCPTCSIKWEARSYYSSCSQCGSLGELQVNLYLIERAEKAVWTVGWPEIQAMSRFIQKLQLK